MHARAWCLRGPLPPLLLVVCLMLPSGPSLSTSDPDEFKAKREAVFESAQKPVVTRQGDQIRIAFKTKGLFAQQVEKGRCRDVD